MMRIPILLNSETFILEKIENIGQIYNIENNTKIQGVIFLTNYRLLFTSYEDQSPELSSIYDVEIPYSSIKSAKRMKFNLYEGNKGNIIKITTKNYGVYYFQFPLNAPTSKVLLDIIDKYSDESFIKQSFTFKNKENDELLKGITNGWNLYNLVEEWKRYKQDIHSSKSDWRILDVNMDHSIVEEYPVNMVVPNSITYSQLRKSIECWEKGHFPVVLWLTPQGSTLSRSMNVNSEKLLLENFVLLRTIGLKNSNDRELKIFDVHRSTQTSLNRNFLDLHNNSTLSEYYSSLLKKNKDKSTDNAAQWKNIISSILLHTTVIVNVLCIQKSSVLIIGSKKNYCHYILTSLVQLLSDPYSRTIHGFCYLIEKNWIQYSFPFGKMNKSKDYIAYPHFHLFIHIVWMLIVTYPTEFEFGEVLLEFILDNVFSSRFGTFLMKNISDYENFKDTVSIWTYILKNRSYFYNVYYSPSTEHHILNIDRYIKAPPLWNSYLKRKTYKVMRDHIESVKNISNSPSDSYILKNSINSLPYIPEEITDLKNITILHFKSNRLEHMPLGLFKLIHLEELSLMNNPISYISENWLSLASIYLKKLRVLDLEKTGLISFPTTLHIHLKSLEHLKIGYIVISSMSGLVLPNKDGSSLRKLDLQYNKLSEIPVMFHNIVTLTHLNLSGNEFTQIPYQLCYLENLKSLDFSFNKIKTITINQTGVRFISLESINLRNNEITEIHDVNDMYSNISYLDLSNNQITKISPEFFKNVKKLETLFLSNNKLKELPDTISMLKRLENIDLSFNELKEMPSEILYLTNLKVMLINDNELEDLSVGFGKLRKLTHLDISNNRLVALPAQLGMLIGNLKTFKFSGNDLVTPPPEITMKGTYEVLSFLSDLLSGSKPIHRIKLMIIGEENVGKTTMVDQMIRRWNTVSIDDIYTPCPTISTDGIDISTCSFRWKNEGENKINKYKDGEEFDVNVSFWDFAGQEVYYSTHQFFLSERSVFIVIWNVERPIEESRVEHWLCSIQSKVSRAQVLIVGTHLDGLKKDMRDNLPAYLKQKKVYFRNLFGSLDISFHVVSCRTGEGMNEFKNELEKIIVNSKYIGEVLPSSYILLEKLVIEQRKNVPPVVSKQKFTEMGFLCNISGEKELNRASNLLHNLGTLIHFDKDPVLSQYVILEPQWLAKVMATLVSTKKSFITNGILPHSLIKQIWMQYPKEMYPFLLTLLEKFEVVYNMTGYVSDSLNSFKIVDLKKPKEQQVLSMLFNKAKGIGSDLLNVIKGDKSQRSSKRYESSFKFGVIPKRPQSQIFIGNSLKRRSHHVYGRSNDHSMKQLNEIISRVSINSTNESHDNSIISPEANRLSLPPRSTNYDEFDLFGASLIPALLPDTRPSELKNKWSEYPQKDEEEINRRWILTFIPNGFFSRLIVRLLQCFFESKDELFYWKSGLLIIKSTFKLYTMVCEIENTTQLIVYVRSKDFEEAAKAFCSIVESITFLFKEWNRLKFTIEVTCPHCRANGYKYPNSWDINDVIQAVKSNMNSIEASYEDQVCDIPLERLAPDIKLVYLRDISINYNELEIEEKVGQGGFAIVYKGKYKGEVVAVKKLNISSSTDSEEEQEAYQKAFNEFRTETFIMMDIKDPHTVKLLGVCFDPFCIVTEFIPHGNLFQLCNNTEKYPEFSWELRLKIALDIAQGMAYLHSKTPTIIHNDLKSPNILLKSLNPNDPVCAKVSDFGLSQKITKIYRRLVDNPIWIAPEIMRGQPYDYKADIYAFGVILWEMLERKPYFSEVTFYSELENIIMRGDRPPITQECIPEYEKVMKLCWDNDPLKRPSFDVIAKIFEFMLQKYKAGEIKPVPIDSLHLPKETRKRNIRSLIIPEGFDIVKNEQKKKEPHREKYENNETKQSINYSRKRNQVIDSASAPVLDFKSETDNKNVFTREKMKLNIGSRVSVKMETENVKSELDKIEKSSKDIKTSNEIPTKDKNVSKTDNEQINPKTKEQNIVLNESISILEDIHNLIKPKESKTERKVRYIDINDAKNNLTLLRQCTQELVKKNHRLIQSVRNIDIENVASISQEINLYCIEIKNKTKSVTDIVTWSDEENNRLKKLSSSMFRAVKSTLSMTKYSRYIKSLEDKNYINEFNKNSREFAESIRESSQLLKEITFETGQTVFEIIMHP